VVDNEHKHQFPIRRAFWLKYFDQGEVTDAWVILGSRAQRVISALIREGGADYRALKWSKLLAGSSDQCALLMKLGDTTVMEFSHNGKVRMWDKNDAASALRGRIPVLHQSEYRAEELRANCPDHQMFVHDHSGNWRSKATRCMAKLSGKSVKL